eukprot:2383154-Amphidinium_carterae.1
MHQGEAAEATPVSEDKLWGMLGARQRTEKKNGHSVFGWTMWLQHYEPRGTLLLWSALFENAVLFDINTCNGIW